jgi:hypothetical protein
MLSTWRACGRQEEGREEKEKGNERQDTDSEKDLTKSVWTQNESIKHSYNLKMRRTFQQNKDLNKLFTNAWVVNKQMSKEKVQHHMLLGNINQSHNETLHNTHLNVTKIKTTGRCSGWHRRPDLTTVKVKHTNPAEKRRAVSYGAECALAKFFHSQELSQKIQTGYSYHFIHNR